MKRSCAVVALLCAWVLWENVTGVLENRRVDFWLLKEPFDTRKECLVFATENVSARVGETPESLLWLMEKASRQSRRQGWTLERNNSVGIHGSIAGRKELRASRPSMLAVRHRPPPAHRRAPLARGLKLTHYPPVRT